MKKATALMLAFLMLATLLTGCGGAAPEPELPVEEPEQIQPVRIIKYFVWFAGENLC